MSWVARRRGGIPSERLAALVKQLEAAGHPVSKIVNGKPVTDLSDSELEALVTGQISLEKTRARSKGETVDKKDITSKPRKGRARKTTKKVKKDA